MQLNDFILYAVFVAGNALITGSEAECESYVSQLCDVDADAAENVHIYQYNNI